MSTCSICRKPKKENTEFNSNFCQGHSRPEIIRHNKARFD